MPPGLERPLNIEDLAKVDLIWWIWYPLSKVMLPKVGQSRTRSLKCVHQAVVYQQSTLARSCGLSVYPPLAKPG